MNSDRFFFTDNTGQKWSLKQTWADLETLRDHPDIDLDVGRIIENNKNVFAVLYGNPLKLLCIAVELTRDQRKGTAVEDDKAFLKRLEGEVLDDATRAFVAGLTNCLPKHQRAMLEAAVASAEIQIPELTSHAASLLSKDEKLSNNLKKKLDKEFDKMVNEATA